jgi:hypothetical protein
VEQMRKHEFVFQTSEMMYTKVQKKFLKYSELRI